MTAWMGLERLANLYEHLVLTYAALLAVLSAAAAFLGVRAVDRERRRVTALSLDELREGGFHKPVSILVPAYNEEATVVASVQSLLALDHPQFEVIVAADGPRDATLERLVAAFELEEAPIAYHAALVTKPVHRVLRSLRHPRLTVVDKENGGKADAANAALNLARYPLVCVVDADSLLDGEALLRVSRPFIEDERVVGVGGTIRPVNGAEVRDGHVGAVRAPRRWIERVQVLEYARAFFVSRAAWSSYNSLLIISGAFGLFRRDVIVEVGGWQRGFVADDMEMVVKLHRHHRDTGRPYRLVTVPDPVCWTEVPSSLRALRRQRHGWERGMLEVLWKHRAMVGRRRYGRVGRVGLPYLWVFEAAAAPIEASGYLYLLVTALTGRLDVTFALTFALLSVLFGVVLSQLAFGLALLTTSGFERPVDRLRLFAAAFVEFVGIRQTIVFARAKAVFDAKRLHGTYWTEQRSGLGTTTLPADRDDAAGAGAGAGDGSRYGVQDAELSARAREAFTLWVQGRVAEAMVVEEAVLLDRVRRLGTDHPATLQSFANVAESMRRLGRVEEALEIDRMLVERRAAKLGAQHPSTTAARVEQAFTLAAGGRGDEALATLRRCAADRVEVLGAEHPHTVSTLATVARWQQRARAAGVPSLAETSAD